MNLFLSNEFSSSVLGMIVNFLEGVQKNGCENLTFF